MEIRSLHIDFDKRICEINGKPATKKTIAFLPSAFDGWYNQMCFNGNASNAGQKSDCVRVMFVPANTA